MKQNIIKYIFAVIVIGLILYACYMIYGKKEEEVNKPKVETGIQQTKKITNIRIPIVNFDTINPILSKNQNIQDIARLIYEPLLNINSENKIELCLAKEWTKQSSTSYVIKLKENVKWQNGNMLTAKDVQFTMDRLKDSKVSSIYAYNVEYVSGVEVIDEYTIKINLNTEVPFFEYNLTFPILSYEYYQNEDFVTTSKNTAPTGTGRFKVTGENGNIFLKKNENWWNLENENSYLDTIYLVKYANMGEVYNAFKIENIDLLTTQTLNLEEYIGMIGYNQKEYYGRQLEYLSFNCDNKILSNVEVRKAISYLINKDNIISSVYKGKYYIANFPLDPNNYLYQSKQVSYEWNLEKARTILEENGWNYTKKRWQKTKDYKTQKLQFNLVVNSSNTNRVAVAEIIKTTLEEFGIDINLKKVSDQEYWKYIENKNYDMLLTGMNVGYSPDLSSYFGENNLANFNQEEMKQIINEVKNIQDEKVLKEKYQRMVEIYEEQMPYVFLSFNKNHFVYHQKLVGEMNPNRYNSYQGISSWYRQ